jgi:hypothetical protein
MITLDDWSELVTIDYNGGMGGEFFGLLLHDAIYKIYLQILSFYYLK